MRVALDAIPLASERTGVGHYTFELARHLALAAPAHQFELVSPFPFLQPISNEELPGNLKAVQPRTDLLRRRWFALGLPLYLKQSAFDLFHGTNYEVPIWNTCPTILTIHDLSLFIHPETHEPRLVRRGRRRLPLMARRATRIITPSERVKREACEHLRISPSKVVVISEAPRSIFQPMAADESHRVRKRLKVEDDFILCVGTIEPRKNLPTLLKAFESILQNTPLLPQLVIAGGEGWLTESLSADVKRMGITDRVCFTGYLADQELRALYSSCSVFVYPALYEGFGLPPLEAMACGAPVVASGVPSIVEGTGVDAAQVVSPADVQALARNIVEILDDKDERLRLATVGRQRAANFSWEQAARATLDVYNEVLNRKNNID